MADNLQMMLKSVQQELKSIKEAQTRYGKEYMYKNLVLLLLLLLFQAQ